VSYLITGAAGFIGYHVATRLLERGERVIGLDSLTDYYSVTLKKDRLANLSRFPNFVFHQADLADLGALTGALKPEKKIRKVIHLAALAGVRHSIDQPHACIQANVVGHVNILEYCRHIENLEVLAYASSSSVYGGDARMPSSESQRVDNPISLYAATKKADELISNVYAHLYAVPLIGFRFFTVYGPWGRPDMAMWLFTSAILADKPILVFNHGKMRRDFTYIDDIVNGILLVVESPARAFRKDTKHRVYNIGNNQPEDLLHMIGILETALGREAKKHMLPMQSGDVPESYADIQAIGEDFGFKPTTPIAEGIPKFVNWYLEYHSSVRTTYKSKAAA
jgi:UDP-glucuronate 4-epimerase